MMSTQSNEEEHIFANELRSAGPEGSGRKNFKMETQCNQKSGPRGFGSYYL
jgi:hypothetical protein